MISFVPRPLIAVSTAPCHRTKSSFAADSLAIGILVMLAMTLVGRGLGFVRGIWFCRVLDDASVGVWGMAHDFLGMVTPIVLLGMPGCLPRYAEMYREQGHLPALVRRLTGVTIVFGGLFFFALLLFPAHFGWLVFLDSDKTSLVHSLSLAFLVVVAFNFIRELVSSLRQVRVVSLMQFVQSVAFTVLGIGWLTVSRSVAGLIYAFTFATLLAIIPGLMRLRDGWAGLPPSDQPFDANGMWRRVLPFAIALWSMNLLTNLFSLSDRYMILHWLPGPESSAQSAVGQYHSGRIFPVLLMSLAAMVGSILLPYLSADWENGRRSQVCMRMRQILFGVAAIFSSAAAVVLLFSPWIFGTLLQGRYEAGLELMPMAFVFSIWVALATIGENYLWVVERGKLAALAMGVGLAANVLMNLLLIPIWGLHGAVVATTLANFVMLLGTWWGMSWHGYRLDETAIYATLLPATLLAGPWATLISVTACTAINPQARGWCVDGWQTVRARFSREGE